MSNLLNNLLIPVFLALIVTSQGFASDFPTFESKARSAIVIDIRTGLIMYSKNPYEPRPPASMAKLMTPTPKTNPLGHPKNHSLF